MKLHQTLLAALVLIVTTTGLEAGVILTVDVTDPANVVFASTIEDSEINVSDDSVDGLTLISFFSGNVTPTNILADSGTIDVFNSNAATTRSPLDEIFIGSLTGGWTTDDVNFFNTDVFDTHFFTDERALVGSVTHDLSAMSAFPGFGSVGDIVVGEPNSSNVIGQWQVLQPPSTSVPEPGTFGMMLSCAVMALAARSWRGRQRLSDSNNV